MTYSILAIDREANEIGMAVQTAYPGVGRICVWLEPGVGGVATQASSRISHGPDGLQLLRSGYKPDDVVPALLRADDEPEIRQVGVIDNDGHAAAHTGQNTIPHASHIADDGFSVHANMMLNDGVPEAMATAFKSAQGPLIERLLVALEAAQDAGGDYRGEQSAALKIVTRQVMPSAWQGVKYDIRVDDHATPNAELRRIAQRRRAYNAMNDAITAAEAGNADAMQTHYRRALALDPEDGQITILCAIYLADRYDQVDFARSILHERETWNMDWRLYLERFIESGQANHPDRLKSL